MKDFNQIVKDKKNRIEDGLNVKFKNSNISWGLIILIAAGLYAFYRLMKFVFYFFS